MVSSSSVRTWMKRVIPVRVIMTDDAAVLGHEETTGVVLAHCGGSRQVVAPLT